MLTEQAIIALIKAAFIWSIVKQVSDVHLIRYQMQRKRPKGHLLKFLKQRQCGNDWKQLLNAKLSNLKLPSYHYIQQRKLFSHVYWLLSSNTFYNIFSINIQFTTAQHILIKLQTKAKAKHFSFNLSVIYTSHM